nr:MAG TPA: hypothetical protein [Caudoviricetes sp.]
MISLSPQKSDIIFHDRILRWKRRKYVRWVRRLGHFCWQGFWKSSKAV